MGAIKLYGPAGGAQLESQISINGSQRIAATLGLRQQRPPMHITTDSGSFYVGPGAHDWGRPIESLDYERLVGSPEMKALFYGALAHYPGLENQIAITVALPIEPLTGDAADANIQAVKTWLRGEHAWRHNGQQHTLAIQDVKIASQATGALFDYLLDSDGKFIPDHKAHFKQEIGVVSIGFNTIELMVVKDKVPIQKFTAGATKGVRRLLEIINSGGLYSLGELDAKLRAGQLDVSQHTPVWARELDGFVDKTWERTWKRFAAVVVVGGGAILLQDHILAMFGGKAIVPDNPILSIARGLYKLGLPRH